MRPRAPLFLQLAHPAPAQGLGRYYIAGRHSSVRSVSSANKSPEKVPDDEQNPTLNARPKLWLIVQPCVVSDV